MMKGGLVKLSNNYIWSKRNLMKICKNYTYSRNYHRCTAAASCFTCSFNSTASNKSSSSYLQTSPYSNYPDNPHIKYHGAKEETQGGIKTIRKGDTISLHDLLFTKDRDYLVRYNGDQQVKATHLAGKVVVLFFVSVHRYCSSLRRSISYLIDTHTYLLPDNNFEVVLVAHGIAEDILPSDSSTNSKKKFEDIFSCMPWTAIPFSDIASRERLASIFGIGSTADYSATFVIDPFGIVLQTDGFEIFERYGGLGYPFSDEWIEYLEIQDAATAKKPSLNALLGSPKRDYVISNKGDKVLINTLEEKVVALYFYEEGITPTYVTANLKKAYKEFALNKSCFEVVLIYLYGTKETLDRTSEESFCNTFETMPWLAIPFKDPKCERLARFFGYPNDQSGVKKAPMLVIFGPHGEFIEPWGAYIMCMFKLPAFPFTRDRVAKLYTEKLGQLNLEMLWEQNSIFRRKDESKVRFSQLVGKRIILFFEGVDEYRRERTVKFLSMLKERYLNMKGTSDEFEVIYITLGEKEASYHMHIADVPWFLSPASELLPADLSLYCCYCHLLLAPTFSVESCEQCNISRDSSMLAFDKDGRVVRKSLNLGFNDSDFPFLAVTMEQEAFRELDRSFGWEGYDFFHWGLRINSHCRNEELVYIYRSNIPINGDDCP